MSLVVTKFKNNKSIIGQIRHLRNYAKQNFKGKMAVSNRSRIYPIYKAAKEKDFKKLLGMLFVVHPVTSVLIKMPHAFIALWAVLVSNELTVVDVFFVAGFSIYVITSSKYFVFLGESERYLIYISPFTYLVLWNYIIEENVLALWCATVYGMFYLILEIIIQNKKKKGKKV